MCKKLFVIIVVEAVFFFAGSLMIANQASAAETTGPKMEQPATSPEMTGEQPPAETTPGVEISPKMEEPVAQPVQTPAKKKTAKRKPAQKKSVVD